MKESKPKIGILGLMQELYDDMIPGITRHQENYIEEVVSHLGSSIEIYFPGAARNRTDVENFTKEFHDKGMAGIMVVNLVYGPGVNLVRALQNMRLPLLLANIQPEQTVSISGDQLLSPYSEV